MNERRTPLAAPIGIMVAAAAITFIPMPSGGIRIIQALWLIIGFDNVVVAALFHGLALGGLAWVVVWWSGRRGWSLGGNVVALSLFGVYAIAYFAIGIPMVA